MVKAGGFLGWRSNATQHLFHHTTQTSAQGLCLGLTSDHDSIHCSPGSVAAADRSLCVIHAFPLLLESVTSSSCHMALLSSMRSQNSYCFFNPSHQAPVTWHRFHLCVPKTLTASSICHINFPSHGSPHALHQAFLDFEHHSCTSDTLDP